MIFKSAFLLFWQRQANRNPACLSGNILSLGVQGSQCSNTTSSLIERGVSQSSGLTHGNTVPKA